MAALHSVMEQPKVSQKVEEEYTIYSKSGCPYCDKAKEMLDMQFLSYVEYSCDIYLLRADDKAAFLATMDETTKGWRTFPMIFHRDVFVGGYTDLVKYLADPHED